jgi:hypothetical protein
MPLTIRRFTRLFLTLSVSIILIITILPIVNASTEWETGNDAIWIEEGPWIQVEDGHTIIHVSIGYTHWDVSRMQVSLKTPVLAGGSGYVLVLEDSTWSPGRNYPNLGYIDYDFSPSESISYWQAQGKFVNPSVLLRFEMISTTSGILIIDEVPWPWE